MGVRCTDWDTITTTAYFWGDRFEGESENTSSRSTLAVGRYPANPFGLHDMHGSAWELVQDVWHHSDTRAPSVGSAWMNVIYLSRRVVCGGLWGKSPPGLHSAHRLGITPDTRGGGTGLRIARTF
jgi:formylglycine-generating enzyme required for sulfatase activity